jgi:hypothetical protein
MADCGGHLFKAPAAHHQLTPTQARVADAGIGHFCKVHRVPLLIDHLQAFEDGPVDLGASRLRTYCVVRRVALLSSTNAAGGMFNDFVLAAKLATQVPLPPLRVHHPGDAAG